MDFHQFANGYLSRLKAVVEDIDLDILCQMVDEIVEIYHSNNKIFLLGNGGSASTASHMSCDINKGCCFDLERKFKAISLNDSIPMMLALANDVAYDAIFVEQLKNYLDDGDLVLGISGSGNSENVLKAVFYAKERGCRTFGWCGFGGGKLSEIADVALIVESSDMQQVEDVHMILSHMVMQSIYARLHSGNLPY